MSSQPDRSTDHIHRSLDSSTATVRAAGMIELYGSELCSLEEVGAAYGVSRERARQIVRKAGYTGRRGIGSKLQAVIKDAVAISTSLQEAAQHCHMRPGRLKWWLQTNGQYRSILAMWRERRSRHYRDAVRCQLIQELRRVSSIVGRRPTVRDLINYAEIAHTRYYSVFGSLQAAYDAAELGRE
jgi:hypothetical protein